jgi:hypothetical protein
MALCHPLNQMMIPTEQSGFNERLKARPRGRAFFVVRRFATIFLLNYAKVSSLSGVQKAAWTIGTGVFRT